ncbi:MAG TPA: response regulator [Polyangiaceae bacterium]|jgi:CheY-like chemotaxis protein|nr:response regulator [Polyangiaceae bacterium]
MTPGSSDEPALSLPPEMLRELASAGVDPEQVPNLEQWQTLLLRFAHRFRDEHSPLHLASSALGHELRTPMTVVIGASELLLESELDPDQRQAAQNVHRSGQELLSVIDQLLSEVTEQGQSIPPRALGPSNQRGEAAKRRFRVLLAEDNEFNRALIERVLRTLNCDVDLVPSGREAVRRFHQGNYDLVLMDCHMPDLDGLEATRQIRAIEGPERRVPILAVTAGTVPGARQACLQAGMDDFIAKPFTLSTLRRKASHWLSVAEQSEPARDLPEAPRNDAPQLTTGARKATAGAPASVDLSRLQELADEAGSPRIVEELSLIFVEDMDRRLEALREATDERVERKLLSVIHSVKGACANFGALRMAVLAEAIERRAKRGDLLGLDLEVGELCTEFQVVRRVLDLEVFGIRAQRSPPADLLARIG